jgi:hypothetical protein
MSKKVYRCSGKKERKSETFTSDSNRSRLLRNYLNQKAGATDPVSELFGHPLPVKSMYASRFVPAGFKSNAMYFSEDREVTFYEYIYHVATCAKVDYPIRLIIFEADLDLPKGEVKNINKLKAPKKKKILSPVSYTHSHLYMNQLKNIPKIVIYENVRSTSHLNNYATFNKSVINNFLQDPTFIEASIITAKDHFNVTIYENGTSRNISFSNKMILS